MPESIGGSLPSRIGRFRILERIGRGAMGVVYAAHDEVIGRPVALKVLMADLESDPETRVRFHREAQAAARLLHPNIISIFDAGEDQGRPFIAMQLLEGVPLAAYLERPEAGALERKLDLMIQVCEGLAAAHGQGIVHRDLKPSNLFVQNDGLLKILDFGVARFVDSDMTPAGTILGTPDYMSPEQARGSAVDERSDIFSAGAVFYFILAGRKPFPGPGLPAVLRQLQFEEPAPMGDAAPRELENLVLQAMAKDMEERPARVEDLLATLVRYRRQYRSETRKLVMAARTQLDEVSAAIAAIGEASEALGIPRDESLAESLRGIQQRFPLLASRAPSSDAAAFERTRVTGALAELEIERDELNRLLTSHRSLVARLQSGETSLAGGDARGALRCFEEIVAACPSSSRARERAESARPLAAEQEKREEQIAVRTTAAREAIEIEAQEFEMAEAALKEADSMTPVSPGVRELKLRLATERATAEAAELLRQLSVEEIRRARSIFRRGRADEAVQQLRGFLEVEPDAREVADELGRLVALRGSLAAAAGVARRKVVDCLSRAAALTQAGNISEALDLARAAIHFDPTDADAAALIHQLLTRQLEERIAHERNRALEERSHDVERILESARRSLEQGYVANALHAALAAQKLLPDRTDIAALVEEARSELTSEDHEMFELAIPDSMPAETPAPSDPESRDATVVSTQNEPGVLDWAADLLRSRGSHAAKRRRS